MRVTWQHVYPVNDKKKHNLTENFHKYDHGVWLHACKCDPVIDNEHNIVIHNAWDIREAQEYINKQV